MSLHARALLEDRACAFGPSVECWPLVVEKRMPYNLALPDARRPVMSHQVSPSGWLLRHRKDGWTRSYIDLIPGWWMTEILWIHNDGSSIEWLKKVPFSFVVFITHPLLINTSLFLEVANGELGRLFLPAPLLFFSSTASLDECPHSAFTRLVPFELPVSSPMLSS